MESAFEALLAVRCALVALLGAAVAGVLGGEALAGMDARGWPGWAVRCAAFGWTVGVGTALGWAVVLARRAVGG